MPCSSMLKSVCFPVMYLVPCLSLTLYTFNRYLYVGTIDVSQENPETIFSIILALDEMQLYAPLEVVQKFFVENYTNWIDKNPVKTLEMASTNDNLSLIKEYIEKIICQEPE